jgi:uncharacterized protein DUF4154
VSDRLVEAEKWTRRYVRILPMMRRARSLTTRALVLVLAALSARPAAADPAIPPTLQAAILAKMLAYDRALKSRAGTSVDVGVLFKESDKASSEAAEALISAFSAMSARPVQGLPLRVAGHAYKDPEHLGHWLKASGIDVVYVSSGLVKEREAIRTTSVDAKAVTVGTDRGQVEGGLAVAVVLKGTTPRILVNMGSAQAVGMDLDPKLLELSDVIR